MNSKTNNAAKTAREAFDADKVQALLWDGLEAAYQSEDLRTQASAKAETMSQTVLAAAKLCGTAAVFTAQMSVFGEALKTPAGVSRCKAAHITLKLSKDGTQVILPPTFKQYVSNIAKGMTLSEDKAMRDENGKPLVPPIDTFKSETELRAVVNSAPVRNKAQEVAIADRPGLTDSQREALSAEHARKVAFSTRFDQLKERASVLESPERQAKALEALSDALEIVTGLWDEQRAEKNAAAQAAREAQMESETAANSLPTGQKVAGQKVANG